MRHWKLAVCGTVASLALLVGAAAARAENGSAPAGRLIEVPPGAVVVVLPAGAMPMGIPAFAPFPGPSMPAGLAMPDPEAMMRDIDGMMARMQSVFDARMPSRPDGVFDVALPAGHGAMVGEMITTVSNGTDVCTRRVTWTGDAAPKVDVSGSGGSCGADALPAALPPSAEPPMAAPGTRVWQAVYRTPVTAAR